MKVGEAAGSTSYLQWALFIPASGVVAITCAFAARLLFSYQNELPIEATRIAHGVLVQTIFLYCIYKFAPRKRLFFVKFFFYLRTGFSALVLFVIARRYASSGQVENADIFDVVSELVVFIGSLLLIRYLAATRVIANQAMPIAAPSIDETESETFLSEADKALLRGLGMSDEQIHTGDRAQMRQLVDDAEPDLEDDPAFREAFGECGLDVDYDVDNYTVEDARAEVERSGIFDDLDEKHT